MRRTVWVTEQTWVSVAAAIAFLGCVLALVLVPTPYTVRGPGGVHDTLGRTEDGAEAVAVQGVATHPTSGRLDLTTVSSTRADARVNLFQALLAHVRNGHDTLDHDIAYPDHRTQEQVDQQNAELMTDSQIEAVVAAMRAADRPVTEHPVVAGVVVDAPAHQKVQPADLVVAVGTEPTRTPADFTAAAGGVDAGDSVTLTVLRDHAEQKVTLTAAAGATPTERLGLQLEQGYEVEADVTYAIDESIGGPSAGFVFSLAIYDKITPGELIAGRHVAGTGTIDAEGRIGAIGGIGEKIAAAEAAGATVFLVPAPNCPDLVGVRTSMQLVRVADLSQAVRNLQDLDANTELESC
ncbi:YlbL family protein [Propionibacteriaceae bacterium Y1685]|uniref:YlbL family protein n=1 Tax=Microlunatus sp. Y1700 TaxID=3418487 RepID=UPI003B7AA66F